MGLQLFNSRKFFFLYVGAIATGVLLALSSLFPKLFVFAWIAFVPLLLSLTFSRSLGEAYRLGFVAGFVLYALSTYWMTDFIQLLSEYSFVVSIALASLYWFYCAQMIALIAVLTYYLSQRCSILWVFPVVVAGVFAFFPTLFSVQVGETQSEFLIALQAIEFTGVSGLDFIIALTNVLIVLVIVRKKYSTEDVYLNHQIAIAYALLFCWFGFGAWSLQHWQNLQEGAATLRIGLAQPNQTPSSQASMPKPGYSLTYPFEMAIAEQLEEYKVDLQIWPEMQARHFYNQSFVRTAYQNKVATWKTPLIFQDREYQQDESGSRLYNTATFLNESGQLSGQYRKMKLIPVAENLPWVGDNVDVKKWLRREFGNFFTDFTAGKEPAAFYTNDATVIPLICYEVMFPQFVANAVKHTASDANSSIKNDSNSRILLALSNNGWFGETRQPYQHLGASVLRSVENRLPMIHAVNNGPSAVVSPSGEKIFQSAYRKTAAYVVDVPLVGSIKNGVAQQTFYSRYPYWFLTLVSISFALLCFRRWVK